MTKPKKPETFKLESIPPNSGGRCLGELLAAALKTANPEELKKVGLEETGIKRYRTYPPKEEHARINRKTVEAILAVVGTVELMEAFQISPEELQSQMTRQHLQGLIASKTELIILLSQKPLELETAPELLEPLIAAVVDGLTMVYWFSPDLAHKFAGLHRRMRTELSRTPQPKGRVLFICGPAEASWITIEIACKRHTSLDLVHNEEVQGSYRLVDQTRLLRKLPDENIDRVLRRIVPIYTQLSAVGGECDGHRLLFSLPESIGSTNSQFLGLRGL